MKKLKINAFILVNDYLQKINDFVCVDTIARTQGICLEVIFFIVGKNLHDEVQMDLVCLNNKKQ